MPTAFTIAAARTALHNLQAVREVTGKTAELRALNAAIMAAIEEAKKLLADPARQPAEGMRRLGEG